MHDLPMQPKHIIAVIAFGLLMLACLVPAVVTRPLYPWRLRLAPSIEDRMPDGSVYNPATQTFVRGYHWLETVNRIDLTIDARQRATLAMSDPDGNHSLTIRHLAFGQLVPRFHYRPASPPDAFDAFNLMLAEYARNSLSVPAGRPVDAMTHFETDLQEGVPWQPIETDYEFKPNPVIRPVRMSVVNNCLEPGRWELIAQDRTGEMYHGWFPIPAACYLDLVAATNGVAVSFATSALVWKTAPEAVVDLARLRSEVSPLGSSPIEILDRAVGYSSQGSRRKLQNHYIQVQRDGGWQAPATLRQLTMLPCRFSEFIDPGIYSIDTRREFDFRFLRNAGPVEILKVRPLTCYQWQDTEARERVVREHPVCIEMRFDFGDKQIVLGNLPMKLLAPQEDYVISGFGVGVLSSGGLAERRRYLMEIGPPPSYAYLCRTDSEGRLIGINSHDFGLEQIFIRTHSDDATPWWEVTITSYERIVDIVKYRVTIPEALHAEFREIARHYVSPLFFSYRDDNIR